MIKKEYSEFKQKLKSEYEKYSKDELIDYLLDLNVQVNDVSQIAIILCEAFDRCENCPCIWDKADKRTKEEHQMGYTCQEQLWNWIVNKIKEEYNLVEKS